MVIFLSHEWLRDVAIPCSHAPAWEYISIFIDRNESFRYLYFGMRRKSVGTRNYCLVPYSNS